MKKKNVLLWFINWCLSDGFFLYFKLWKPATFEPVDLIKGYIPIYHMKAQKRKKDSITEDGDRKTCCWPCKQNKVL